MRLLLSLLPLPPPPVCAQVKCRDRKGLLFDIIRALKLLPLEVGEGEDGAEAGWARPGSHSARTVVGCIGNEGHKGAQAAALEVGEREDGA